jgi:diaminohydroxyphosphoribosylaminopyrimidine deaminase / 5-amino-6-(5-phosphoribosylamino)uracil reductase
MQHEQHSNNMMQCLLLASQAQGYVSPNPMVGAMLVHQGNMIGAGYHMQYGEAHAEVNCIASVQEKNKYKIAESILYVNLEPCNHKGNTPPCTDFIIKQGIKQVVIGTADPHAKVNGAGIQKLKEHGIAVIEGVHTKACFALNRRFFNYHHNQRPYIILKWAQSKDGFVTQKIGDATKITQAETDKIVHTWRTQ